MYRLLLVVLSLALSPTDLRADFSDAQSVLHPRFPGAGPFLVDIQGTWPSDCHPGEQKPVVESFDGRVAEIGFETIVEHITCNTIATPYRVLVDMSQAIRATAAIGDSLVIRVSFQGATLEQTIPLDCPSEPDCGESASEGRRAEPGLYDAPGLRNQGLLVARQNEAIAIYPLVYGESGNGEWLFSGNLFVEDTVFAEVLRFSGGDCFGCEPTGKTPDMAAAGYLSVLAENPGLLLVKVNDGLFTEYRGTVFGYRTFRVGPAGERLLIDLEGRWGLSENRGTDPPLGNLAEFFPGAFDIEREDILPADTPILPDGQLSYRVTTLLGDTLGQLVCKGQTDAAGAIDVCEFIDPTDAAEPLFLFYQEGPSTLAIEYGRAAVAVGTPPGGRAVRLD